MQHYCNPTERSIGGTTWPEGVCVRVEDCEPGYEGETCGGGSTCVLLNRGMACATWADQLHVNAPPVALCIDVCDVVSQTECPAEEHCVINEPAGDVVITRCQSGGHGEGLAGEPCEWADDEVGSCSPGHLCRSFVYREPPFCVPLCTAPDTSRCALSTACRTDQSEWGDALGLCSADCAPFSAGQCEADERCVGAEVFVNAAGAEVFLGRCTVPGLDVIGEGEYIGMSRPKVCDEGLVAVATGGLGRYRCSRACRSDGAAGAICLAEEECRPITADGSVWGYCASSSQ